MLVKGIVTTGDTSVATTRADIIFAIAIRPTTIDTIHIPIGIAATLTVAGSALASFLINRTTPGSESSTFHASINAYVSTRRSLGEPRHSLPQLPSRPAVRISSPSAEQPGDEEAKEESCFSKTAGRPSRPTAQWPKKDC
jgi:hypothetical protein